MDFIITFFRDILDGPLYIIVTVICSILICACIGYLAEKRQKKRQAKEQYVEVSNVSIPSATVASSVPTVPAVPSTASTAVVTPVISTVPSQEVGGNVPFATPVQEVSTSTVAPVQIEKPSVVPIPTTSTAIASTPNFATAPLVQPTLEGETSVFNTTTMPSSSNLGQSPEVPTSVNQG